MSKMFEQISIFLLYAWQFLFVCFALETKALTVSKIQANLRKPSGKYLERAYKLSVFMNLLQGKSPPNYFEGAS